MLKLMSTLKKSAWVGVCMMGLAPLVMAQAPAAPKADKPAADAKSGKTIMTVNGEKVTQGDLDQFIDSMVQRQQMQMMRMGQQMPTTATQQLRAMIEPQAPEELIKKTLFEKAVNDASTKVTDEQVKALASKVERAMQAEGLSKEEIAQQNLSSPEAQKQLKQMLAVTAVAEKVAGPVTPTEDQLKAEFAKSKNDLDEVSASHILIGFKGDPRDPNYKPSDQEKKEAKAKAEEILKKVKAGEDFAKLAKENSTCPSKDKGGDLGFFSKNKMVPEFSKAAFATPVNQLVPNVVETQFGFHVIKVTGKRTKTFEDMKDKMEFEMAQQALSEKVPAAVAKMRKEAKVVDADGKPIPAPAEEPMMAPGAAPQQAAPAATENKK